MPKITLTNEECIEYFYNALCNGVSYIQDYGLELTWNEEEYKKSKEHLNKYSDKVSIYVEDVWIQMLKDGYSLQVIDEEGEGDNDAEVTLEKVIERVPNTPEQHLIDMMCENDDATTADVILQTVFYNEVIFG